MILGIDPGISGAIAAVTDGGALMWVHDMPVRDAGKKARKQREIDGAELARMLRLHLAYFRCAWVEEVSAMPGQGVSSMFSLGDSRGTIRGVLEALGVSVERVPPQRWKRAYGLDSDKEAARGLAIRLYPMHSGELARKRDHGRAEAVLIARYGAQQQRAAESFLGEAA